jgi:hypothetical protein
MKIQICEVLECPHTARVKVAEFILWKVVARSDPRAHPGRPARERGSKGGRRPVVTPDKLRKARTHIAAGLTVREAAARLKIGKTALYKALEQRMT